MNETHSATGAHDQSGIYEIRLRGHLDSRWASWFDGLSVTLTENGDTLLTGPVVDQAALHGLLKKARDLGLPLQAVNYVESGRKAAQEHSGRTIVDESI